jgi:hypothetical protein
MTPARRTAVALVLLLIAFVMWRWPLAERQKRTASKTPAVQKTRPPAPIRLSEAQVAHDPAAAAGAIEGSVRSVTTGIGIGGAELVFEHGGAAHTVVAGADGAFRLVPREAGQWRLAQVSAAGYFPWLPDWGQSPVVFELRAGERLSGVTIHLVPQVDYVGSVVDAGGKAVAGAEVRQLEPASAEHWTSDAKGEFHFHAPDGALFEATSGGSTGRAALDLAAQSGHRLTIKLGAAPVAHGAIAGRVLDADGSAAAGAQVTATFLTAAMRRGIDRHPTRSVAADAEGRFTIDALDAGPHQVQATLPDRAPARAEPVQTGTANLELRLTAGSKLRGVVRDQKGPLAAFAIALSRKTKGVEREPLTPRTFFDAQGQYEVRGLVPGSYVVQAVAAGHAPSPERTLEIGASDATADFELARGGRIRGTVRDRKTHEALAGAAVSVEGLAGGDSFVTSFDAHTGPDGNFEIGGVAGANLSILAAAADHHSRILSGLAADGPPIVVELTATEPGEEPRIELAGIGAQMTAHEDALLITMVAPGGGAAEAGLVPGDAVVSVEGQPVEPLGLAGAVAIIRGLEDSYVHLGIRKSNRPPAIEIPVRRKRILF